MSEFDNATAVTRIDDSRWAGEIAPGWSIAGNPNGGYLLAIALRAASEAAAPPDPVATSAQYLSPAVVGPVDVTVEVLKRGRRMTTVSASLGQEGRERLRATATFADLGAAAGPTLVTAIPPSLPPPDECVAREAAPGAQAVFPEFVERFDIRLSPTVGWVRGERTGRAVIEGWIRFADGREPDVASLPLFADAFPPAVLDAVEAAWVPTLELGVHVRSRPAPGWLRARFSTRALIDGFLEEDGELWDSAGRLVAMSRQLALLLPG